MKTYSGTRKFLVLLPVLVLPDRIMRIICSVIFISFVISFLVLLLQIKGLKYRRLEKKIRAFRGTALELGLEFSNRGVLPLSNFYFSDPTGDLYPIDLPRDNLTLASGRKKRYIKRAETRHRGKYFVGPLTIEGSCPLGLFNYRQQTNDSIECIVYPKVYPLEYIIHGGLPAGCLKISDPLYEDATRYRSVREYVPGDPLSHISWKHSAKTGKLMTREFLPTYNYSALLVMNLCAPDYDLKGRYAWIERIIETAASMVFSMVRQKQEVGLICAGKMNVNDKEEGFSVGIGGGEDQAMQVLELLACVNASQSENFPSIVEKHIFDIPWNARIIYLGPKLEDDKMFSLIKIWRANRKFDFLLADTSDFDLPDDTPANRFFKIKSFGEDLLDA